MEMSFKKIVRELREMKDGIGNISRRGAERKQHLSNRTRSHIVPYGALSDPTAQGQWANLPAKVLLDIIRRVEESEVAWPARSVIVFCASVCRSWRKITKEVVKTPEECSRLTFPISLKQPGPREYPIQCFIKRDKAKSVYRLYIGMVPSESERDKLLLAAKKIRRATSTEFVISLAADDFSQGSNTYVGKLRSNFVGTKFSIYDSQPSSETANEHGRLGQSFQAKKVSPGVPACNYRVATVSYEVNIVRRPRRIHCAMHSIPFSSIQEGGSAPTPTSFPFSTPLSITKEPAIDISLSDSPLLLKNKFPRWHQKLQFWCLNFKGRVTVASVKNFQLLAAVDPSHNIPVAEQEKIILQFGKIGKDWFTMDYRYPLSAFQAFAICLTSFDSKPAFE